MYEIICFLNKIASHARTTSTNRMVLQWICTRGLRELAAFTSKLLLGTNTIYKCPSCKSHFQWWAEVFPMLLTSYQIKIPTMSRRLIDTCLLASWIIQAGNRTGVKVASYKFLLCKKSQESIHTTATCFDFIFERIYQMRYNVDVKLKVKVDLVSSC